MLYLSGFRAARADKHYRTITSLPMTLGPHVADLARYLDRCRVKRHELTYEKAFITSLDEAEELIETVKDLNIQFQQWVRDNHPEIVQ